MVNRTSVSTLFLGLGLIAIFSAHSQADSASSSYSPLRQIYRRTTTLLRTGDLMSFCSLVSANGLVVVKRYVDWNQSEQTQPSAKIAVDSKWISDLDLTGLDSLVWDEHTVKFDKSDIPDAEFRTVFSQFHGLILNTLDGYPRTLTFSSNLQDKWYCTPLGPGMEGKIASNSFWLVYFDREHGQWKIWKLECVTH